MEVKADAPKSAPVVKNENQNAQGNKQGGPSGNNNKFNNQGGAGGVGNRNLNNPRQNNKNFQPKGNRNMPMQMGMRGPPKGEVIQIFIACFGHFSLFLVFFFFTLLSL